MGCCWKRRNGRKTGILLTKNTLEAVDKAREFFEVKGFPGDFFAQLEKIDYTYKYNVLLENRL